MKNILFIISLLVSTLALQAQTISGTTEENTPGKQWTLTLSLQGGASSYTALQAIIALPDGVTASDPTGGALFASDHQAVCGTLDDGTTSLICYSPESKAFKSAQGTLVTLILTASVLEQGNYDVTISDVRLSDASGNETSLSGCTAQLTSTYDPSQEPSHYDQTPVTSLAQLSNDKVYTATTRRGSWYRPSGGTQLEATNAPTAVTQSPEDKGQQFSFILYNNRYYIYAVGEKKILNGITTNSPSRGKLVTEDCQPVNITRTDDDSYPFFFYFSSDYNVNINDQGMTIDSWTSQDDGNKVALQEVQGTTLSTDEIDTAITYIQTTYIRSLNDGRQTNNTIYDFSGRRVTHPQKGIYICNGRKIIIN